ncbi:hypothetical protein [Bradyrhizobium sp. LTSP849]|uniref:hypothetical protein n=1 Tax=Bradyrhizobium sp. LTSP849 TaxID=1615890 RepID=UPI0006791CB6|nr:hypothetical protein [Bradyrhizobium sp. LTSP849]
MLQIRTIALRGKEVEDAVITFNDRSNIVAGASDTGKSYLVRCIDYILGADKMKKRIDEAAPYSRLFVEFENSKAEFLTLERGLNGGNLTAYPGKFKDAENGKGETIVPKRKGKSRAKDVTAALFAFAGLQEALLRKNDRGNTNRLTIRTILPLFLVDEVSIIDERSPILGRAGFDETARKRAFAYMLSGKGDEGIVAAERKDIAKARIGARLDLISDLLAPIENRLQERNSDHEDETIDKLDESISKLSQVLSDHSAERNSLQAERREAITTIQHAESQIIAIDELARQYALLNERYRTDLERLDFISEGAHFFEGLQEVRCPLCDQLMSPDHAHKASEGSATVYQAARAEASKILAHKKDLQEANETLQKLRLMRWNEQESAQQTVKRADDRTESILAPAVHE